MTLSKRRCARCAFAKTRTVPSAVTVPPSPSSSTTRPSAEPSRTLADAARESTISARDLDKMLQERERGERDFLLVDVREPAEREIVAIDGSVLIPKNEFLLGSALEQLPQDKPAVFYCKVGARSAEVLAVAKGAGFANAQHVGGGVVAW